MLCPDMGPPSGTHPASPCKSRLPHAQRRRVFRVFRGTRRPARTRLLQLRSRHVAHRLAEQRDSDWLPLTARQMAGRRSGGPHRGLRAGVFSRAGVQLGASRDRHEHARLMAAARGRGVDVALSGHDHHYERFTPLDAKGHRPLIACASRGRHRRRRCLSHQRCAPHSEVRITDYGALKLVLMAGRYEWTFIAVDGQSFTDSGSSACSPARAPADRPHSRSLFAAADERGSQSSNAQGFHPKTKMRRI